MPCKVVIVDYGTGNLSSVRRGLARVGAGCRVSSLAADIESGDKFILAGVGHFEAAIVALRKPGLIDALEKAVLIDKKPVLGICLGMELMAKISEEGTTPGLGWLDAEVVRFKVSDGLKYKVPHIGWSRVAPKRKNSALMKNVPDSTEFYFLHSYYLNLANESDLSIEAVYEKAFPAAVEKDNIFGVQFHPEKSHQAGLQLLKNFVEL